MEERNKVPTPQEILLATNRAHPELTGEVNGILSLQAQDATRLWPEWCFLPTSYWYAILEVELETGAYRGTRLNLMEELSRLSTIGTWRFSQGIYRFDASVLDAVKSTTLAGDIPVEVLERLPEWAVYVETPGMTFFEADTAGFFANLDVGNSGDLPTLQMLFNTSLDLISVEMPLRKATLEECVKEYVATAQDVLPAKQAREVRAILSELSETDLAEALAPYLSLLLYLCSDEPEIDDDREPRHSPSRAQARKTKKGWKFFPPDRLRTWNVGTKLGELLRKEKVGEGTSTESSGGHKSPRTHLRRGHWHGFWMGPMTGKRRFSYRWLAPMVVNAGE